MRGDLPTNCRPPTGHSQESVSSGDSGVNVDSLFLPSPASSPPFIERRESEGATRSRPSSASSSSSQKSFHNFAITHEKAELFPRRPSTLSLFPSFHSDDCNDADGLRSPSPSSSESSKPSPSSNFTRWHRADPCKCNCCRAKRYRKRVVKELEIAKKSFEKAKIQLTERLGSEDKRHLKFCGTYKSFEELCQNDEDIDPEEEAAILEGSEVEDNFIDFEALHITLAKRPPTPPSIRSGACECSTCCRKKEDLAKKEEAKRLKAVKKFRERCNCAGCCVTRGAKEVDLQTYAPCIYIQKEEECFLLEHQREELFYKCRDSLK